MTEPADLLERVLGVDDSDLDLAWQRLSDWARRRYDRDASVESLLFLVGIQTRGRGFTDRLSKELKQDLIMEGTWHVLEHAGLATLDKATGSWKRTIPLPVLDLPKQEKLLRSAIVLYFADLIVRGD